MSTSVRVTLTHVRGFIPWYTLMTFLIFTIFFHVFFLCFSAFSWHSLSWCHRGSTVMCSMSVIRLKWSNVSIFASSPLLMIMKFTRSFKDTQHTVVSSPTLQLWCIQRTSAINTATRRFLGKLFCVLVMSYFLGNWAPEKRHSWVVETERFNSKFSACVESLHPKLFPFHPNAFMLK